MANPLQQFFRQPKIFISLPSKGAYSASGMIQGDVANLPVYSLTGMDEIIIKTPDSLMSGDSTAKIIESCCPAIKDAWALPIIDINILLAAIRIASYGPHITFNVECNECKAESEYDVELSYIVDYFSNLEYPNKLVLKDIAIYTRPMTYRESTNFSIKSYQLRQQLIQADKVEDDVERQTIVNRLFRELAVLQNDMMLSGIDTIQTGNLNVTEAPYISEWLANCDSTYATAIKAHSEKIFNDWQVPPHPITCSSCKHESKLRIDLDYSTFFVRA